MGQSRLLRIVSYNVHRCVGRDRKHDPQRIATVLAEMRPDIIGLQEVESLLPAAATPNVNHQLEFLANRLQMHAVAGPTMVYGDRGYGNGLLTRFPVRSVRHIDLTVFEREPRAALDADLLVEGRHLRVIVTHLGLFPGERREQVRRLLDLVATTPDLPLIVCGDINEWFMMGRPLRWLHRHFGRSPSLRSFPSSLPLLALDRIWVHPFASASDWAVHDSPDARVASDHRPVTVEVRWPPRPGVA